MMLSNNATINIKLKPGFIVINPVPKYRIVIDCDGDTTTAKMIVNGKEVKSATAKRNPADKANWRIGAQVAFDRLWQKQPKPEKPAEKDGFKVGDRVVCVSDHISIKNSVGQHGRIMCINEFGHIGVEFDNYQHNGHGCDGKAKPGYGRWHVAKELRHEQPTKQTVREVKRHAEVGEYVKLTKPAFDFMKTGDIVRVSSVLIPDGSALVRECDLARPSGATVAPNYEWNIFKCYVVLEGYQPKEGK